MKSRWLKKAMAAFLAVLMTVCAVPVAAFVPEMVETGKEFAVEETNDTENDTGLFAQSVVSRDDGVWLFPADSKYYKAFTDFCGCLGNSACPFHKLVHPYMTQAAGWSNCHGWQTYSQGHNGFDVGVPNGSSVYAAASGYYHAVSASSGGSRGAYVYIEHPISGSGYSYYSYYQHLSTVYTNLNNTYVQAGDVIGKSGNSGGNYGYHLHFGIVLGKSGASASVLNNSECKGWLLSPGLAEGEIVANPSSSSPAGLPSSSYANDTRAIQDHCGSVRYTFNKNEVSIGANSNYQQFDPVSINSGEYRLVNNGSYLTTTADNNTTVLTVKAKSGTSNQQFYISPNSRFSQSYVIKSQAYSSGRVVNVFTTGVSANGDNVTLYTSTTDASQSWRFEAKSGGYLIHPVDNTGLALTNSNGTVKVMTSSGASNQIWTLASAVDTYTVSYNANGGTGAPGNQTKTHGQSLTLSSVQPTSDTHNFKGWSTSRTGSVEYNPGSTYTGNADLTLYAVWYIKTYAVKYNANGGTGAPENQVKTHGQSLTLSSVKPTKDGYTFQGWSTTLNGSVQYNPGSAYSGNANLTLYAVWNPVKYPIYFNANGGTGAPDTQYQTHFEYLTLSSVVPKKAGYTFKGWSTTLNGTVAYQPGGQFGENRSVTLYAVWAVIPVTSITLNQTTASLKKGETLTLTATVAPSDAANKSVTWSSSNTSVATVTTSGVVTAIGEGTAVITVKTADGGKTASCTVAVTHTHNYTGTYYETAHPHKAYSKCSCGEISYTGATQKVASCASCYPVTGVTLDKTTATLKKGETLTLSVTVSPSDAANKAFTVTSSNPSVMSAKYRIGMCVGDLFDGSTCTASHCEFTALSAGSTTLTFTTEDGQKTASCTVTVTEPVVNAKAKFTLSETSGRPGDTVKITLSLKTEETVNSIAISGITYDKSIMTFTGFSDYEHIEDLTILPPTFDEEKMAIVIGLKNAAAFDGDICTLNFKIHENALEGVTNIDASSVVKLKSTEIPSAVTSGKVNIRLQTLGDIDGNDTVDIDDAVLLFQYSMLPELYPISYAGNLDFNKDGTVDIDDAVRLFQYSMLPDLYPLE